MFQSWEGGNEIEIGKIQKYKKLKANGYSLPVMVSLGKIITLPSSAHASWTWTITSFVIPAQRRTVWKLIYFIYFIVGQRHLVTWAGTNGVEGARLKSCKFMMKLLGLTFSSQDLTKFTKVDSSRQKESK